MNDFIEDCLEDLFERYIPDDCGHGDYSEIIKKIHDWIGMLLDQQKHETPLARKYRLKRVIDTCVEKIDNDPSMDYSRGEISTALLNKSKEIMGIRDASNGSGF